MKPDQLAFFLRDVVVFTAAVAALSFGGVARQQYALLVGINDYPGKKDDLEGCLNDVETIRKTLTTRFGFPDRNIRLLLDGEATSAALGRALKEHLVDQAKPGDAVFFYYSGHGSQVEDLDGDEPDGKDEIICTFDLDPHDPATWATDDFLRHYLSQLKTNRCLVIMDCCHSGTSTRSVGGRRIKGSRYLDLGFRRGERVTRALGVSKAMRNPTTSPKHVLLAACDSAEEARESEIGGRRGGIFTFYLNDEINREGRGNTLGAMRGKVVHRVSDFVKSGPHPDDPQTPQFEGELDQTLDDLIGLGKEGATPPPVSPPRPVSPPPDITNATTAGEIGVKLSADKRLYRKGDRMTATVTADRDCYLRLYYVDTNQNVTLIFPNGFQKENFIKGGAPVHVPGPRATFAFRMTEPFGQEILKAVVCERQFTDAAADRRSGSPFLQFEDLSLRGMSTRGIRVESTAKTGEALFIYEVRP